MSRTHPIRPVVEEAAWAGLPEFLTKPATLEALFGHDVNGKPRVSMRTWERWCAEGVVPAGVRLGGRRLWPREQLRAWVAGLRERTAA